ncbi:hypothetical protein GYMLUDRAFT_63822 [Collybiopsis luxurians FD-317 M1]|uniref:Unplaced genomic scaffold GYMLUscaffold_84, whole genome shotgun sequence n=1 Tax=Collybiopsis luxurians FD-317 M1 TaxID=944289 RepID=A0A0D0ARX0_9AGAR|nr:hypothetical protein GYMLUDRAFT_63822 [Collybiopsis luxurians FD-317 M1]
MHPDIAFTVALNWVFQLEEGIDFIHSKGVVWGDCHIENILVTDDLSIVLSNFEGAGIEGGHNVDVLPPVVYRLPSLTFGPLPAPPTQDQFAFGIFESLPEDAYPQLASILMACYWSQYANNRQMLQIDIKHIAKQLWKNITIPSHYIPLCMAINHQSRTTRNS